MLKPLARELAEYNFDLVGVQGRQERGDIDLANDHAFCMVNDMIVIIYS